MRRIIYPLKSEEGAVMVMALMIFLIVTLLGTGIISVAAMESKIALNDGRKEQARQLADAGVQVARNVVMNYMANGRLMDSAQKENDMEEINDSLAELEDGIEAVITDVDYRDGLITVQSTGTVINNGSAINKTAVADIKINVLPDKAVHTDEFKILGKYYNEFKISAITTGGGVTRILPLHGPADPENSNLHTINPNKYFWLIDYKYDRTILGIPYVDWGETKGHTFPYLKAQGKVNILDTSGAPATVAINHWAKSPESALSPEEGADLYYKIDPGESLLTGINSTFNFLAELFNLSEFEYHEPIRKLDSYDFIGVVDEVQQGLKVPVFGEEELERFRQLAKEDTTGKWAYLVAGDQVLNNDGNQNTLILDEIINENNPNYIGKPCIFVDLPESDVLSLDFRTYNSSNFSFPDGNWSALAGLINNINNSLRTFLRLFSNELDGITIVTPASIKAGYDSLVFKPDADSEATAIALYSTGDISFEVDPEAFSPVPRIFPDSEDDPSRHIRTFLLAGNNVNITSTCRDLTMEGMISAHNQVVVKIDYFDDVKISEINKVVNIVHDPSVMSDFPEPWTYMGVGTIVSYEYSN